LGGSDDASNADAVKRRRFTADGIGFWRRRYSQVTNYRACFAMVLRHGFRHAFLIVVLFSCTLFSYRRYHILSHGVASSRAAGWVIAEKAMKIVDASKNTFNSLQRLDGFLRLSNTLLWLLINIV